MKERQFEASGQAIPLPATPNRHDPGSFRTRLARHAKEWGRGRALYWALMNILARAIGLRLHYVHVSAERRDLQSPEPPVVPPGYDTKVVGLADLLPYAGRVPHLSREFLDAAFGPGGECAATFFRGELVAYGFISRTRTVVTDQLDVLIPDGFRYSYKAWTHPEHLRRNLQKMCSHVRVTQIVRPWGERLIAYVETHNYPSLLHGYQHPNQRQLFMGYVGWITLFGRQIPFNSRQARKIGFEFVRKEDPGRRQYVH